MMISSNLQVKHSLLSFNLASIFYARELEQCFGDFVLIQYKIDRI